MSATQPGRSSGVSEQAAAVLAAFLSGCLTRGTSGQHLTSATPDSLAMGCAVALSDAGLLAPTEADQP